jgi:thymidylate kinase
MMASELSTSNNGGRGALIVIEGLDRAGKSSQCELLYRSLLEMGHEVRHIRFPGSLQNALSNPLRDALDWESYTGSS